MRIMTLNMNGIRAAHRKGFYDWLPTTDTDVVCVQETKAQMEHLTGAEFRPNDYHSYFSDAIKKGYSGVGIYTKQAPQRVQTTLGFELVDNEGRFCQVDYENLSIISLYLPSGSSRDERQVCKMECLAYFGDFFQELVQSGRDYIVCGDLNIAHTKKDIKNWRGNQKNSGFLPEERAWLTQLFDDVGYVDAFRQVNQADEEYTWWSNRGQAYQNNVGWRIDYQLVSPSLRTAVNKAEIYREQRFSDHAPLLMDYDITV